MDKYSLLYIALAFIAPTIFFFAGLYAARVAYTRSHLVCDLCAFPIHSPRLPCPRCTHNEVTINPWVQHASREVSS